MNITPGCIVTMGRNPAAHSETLMLVITVALAHIRPSEYYTTSSVNSSGVITLRLYDHDTVHARCEG